MAVLRVLSFWGLIFFVTVSVSACGQRVSPEKPEGYVEDTGEF